jgi:Spy/CpxP family protein refolding chaperone
MLKFRTAAVSAAAVIGLAVIAGAQVPAKPDSAHRGDRGGRHGDMRGMRRGGMRGERGFGGEGHLIRDLNLTDAQKSKIKAIHQKYQPQLKTLREQGRTQFESLRSARQKGDTSAAARQRFQAQRQQFLDRVKAVRTQEQNEIRAVLTAEQRAKWDAAEKQREERFKQRQDRMKDRRGAGRSKA